jgi:hypothetical protein
MEIKKVVIPVAGWGTRSLPATKNIPKELLPVYNKPVVQYVVEEAQVSGLNDVVFVTNRNKTIIEDHFDYNLAWRTCCNVRQAGDARAGSGRGRDGQHHLRAPEKAARSRPRRVVRPGGVKNDPFASWSVTTSCSAWNRA